jgi:uncharacterized Zn finger protein (UPF0148 family)
MGRFTVTCPHCQAQLELDSEKELVVASKAADKPKSTTSIEDRLQAMAREKETARARMEEAMRAEKAGSALRDERFRKLLDGVKDEPVEKPVREIDLD